MPSSASIRHPTVSTPRCGCCSWSNELREHFAIPTQSCVLSHVTNTLQVIARGAPVDLIFQSIAGTQAANESFGVSLACPREAHAAGQSLGRGTVPASNLMYFETGQGSALSAQAHHGVDQQTLEARAYAVARAFSPAAGEFGGRVHRPGIPV